MLSEICSTCLTRSPGQPRPCGNAGMAGQEGAANSTRRAALQAGGSLGAAREQAFRVNPGLQVRSSAVKARACARRLGAWGASYHRQPWPICSRCCTLLTAITCTVHAT